MSRFVALDAFRGLTVAAMILVNTPGSREHIYAPLRHAVWHGWTATDFVFPFFLFIVGSAMYFSLAAQQSKNSKEVVTHIIKRACIIFLIGFSINALSLVAEPWPQVRIMGVLQRIAIVYAIASLAFYFLSRRTIFTFGLLVLFAYWGLLVFTGGLTLENNLVRHIDLAILGTNHMWQMQGIHFDPEGLLSTLPAIVNTILGFEVTRFLAGQKDKLKAIKSLLAIGLALIIAGVTWQTWLPINKHLWTPSYVLFSSGVAVVFLAIFIWIVDIKKLAWLEKPLVIYGQNPLFIYTLSMIWPKIFSYVISVSDGEGNAISGYAWFNTKLTLLFSPINASLAFAAIHVGLFWLIAYALYRKNILIKI